MKTIILTILLSMGSVPAFACDVEKAVKEYALPLADLLCQFKGIESLSLSEGSFPIDRENGIFYKVFSVSCKNGVKPLLGTFNFSEKKCEFYGGTSSNAYNIL